MDKKTRKAQVVLVALDPERHSFSFLLMKTNEKRGSFWQNVTGKIEDEETFEEGALREAMEETGFEVDLIVDIVDLNLAHEFTDERKRNVHEKSFLIILDQKWDIKLDPKEHGDFKWIDAEEIKPGIVKHDGNFEALDRALQLVKHWGH